MSHDIDQTRFQTLTRQTFIEVEYVAHSTNRQLRSYFSLFHNRRQCPRHGACRRCSHAIILSLDEILEYAMHSAALVYGENIVAFLILNWCEEGGQDSILQALEKRGWFPSSALIYRR